MHPQLVALANLAAFPALMVDQAPNELPLVPVGTQTICWTRIVRETVLAAVTDEERGYGSRQVAGRKGDVDSQK